MSKVREKIKRNFDNLQAAMESQKHLDEESLNEVLALIESCSKYSRVLDEEHRDFLNAVRDAVEEDMPWR